MAENSRIGRLGVFVLRLRGCIPSTATVAGYRRSGRLCFRSRRSVDSHDSTPLRSSSERSEFRAQKINFYYVTIDDGSRIHTVRPGLYQQPSVAMRAMGSVIARFLGVSVRGCVEFLLARCGAEIVGLPLPDFACRGLFALDRHATDRIDDLHLLSLLSMEHHAFDMKGRHRRATLCT